MAAAVEPGTICGNTPSEAGHLGKAAYEAPAKTSCRIVMIVVLLIAEGFRQAGEKGMIVLYTVPGTRRSIQEEK
jgi:hypothetical protein